MHRLSHPPDRQAAVSHAHGDELGHVVERFFTARAARREVLADEAHRRQNALLLQQPGERETGRA